MSEGVVRETKLWARFLSPGTIVANDWTADIDSLDPAAIDWPDRAYAFSLHERNDLIVDGDRFTGKSRQVGPTYYHPDSYTETLIQVQTRGNQVILFDNMVRNKWERVIWTRWGNWPQPFDPEKMAILGCAA